MSDFKEQVFGGSIGYQLCNNHIKNGILNKLERYYKLDLFKPFNRINKIQQGLPDDIQDYEHLVNFNINAPISYLYLTDDNSAYYITGTCRKDCKLVSTIQRFSTQHDTMFSGYILDNLFLVEDLIIADGHTCNKPLEQRVQMLNHILDYQYTRDPIMDNYDVVLKDYVEYTYLQSFVTEYLQTLPYCNKVNGIVFSPLGNCIVHHIILLNQSDQMMDIPDRNHHESRFEIVKQPKRDQVCFLVKSTDKPDVYHLYLSTGTTVKYYDIASIPDSDTSAHIKDLLKNCTEAVMLCKYDNRSHIQRWQPVMLSNRTTPDTIYRIL